MPDADIETIDRAASAAQAPLADLAFGSIAAQLTYAIAELGIADRLAGGPRSGDELAEEAGVQAPSLRRLLRAAAALGLVDEIGDDRFALTEAGRPLQADAPDSARALVRMLCGTEMWRTWGELVPSVRTGERAWERAHGMPVFDYYGRNPEAAAIFNAAMAEHTRDAAPAIVAAGRFSRFRTVVDVGGGDAMLLAEILRAEPYVEGVVFDVPDALTRAPERLAAAGVADRCRLEAGDFFAALPEGADAYVLKQVLHDWDDERAVAILRNCATAMAHDARVLIAERVLPERPGASDRNTLFVDLLMLAVTGGRERTEREFRALLEQAGLAIARVSDPLDLGYRVIEAVRG